MTSTISCVSIKTRESYDAKLETAVRGRTLCNTLQAVSMRFRMCTKNNGQTYQLYR